MSDTKSYPFSVVLDKHGCGSTLVPVTCDSFTEVTLPGVPLECVSFGPHPTEVACTVVVVAGAPLYSVTVEGTIEVPR
jgi:hypothetical protein